MNAMKDLNDLNDPKRLRDKECQLMIDVLISLAFAEDVG